ncbi:hypothetical protein FZI91_16240 [Mycobacterium sp. CBMA271]|uniref:hypothetical protein n=1 Tax=unclassified Mycobacteroides TaxID=2618759 RepID=UPI0012DCD7CB|nr:MULTISPECIES: hypothetical protein [unclassified Mycobacteroides]MUM18818.1 hypothetical protein [Mycobacteroides sp. CBMA 326]MUM23241.1 hypothetical protein [Mycobacteroides sp. CBMA 271]
MRSSFVSRAAVLSLAAVGAGIVACPVAMAAPAGERALCFDGDVRVSAWQASQADERRELIPGTVNLNATDGLAGPKQAYFSWRNLTTGAVGETWGKGSGTAGASEFYVVTGPGQVEITTDYGSRSGFFWNDENIAHCVGTVTVA